MQMSYTLRHIIFWLPNITSAFLAVKWSEVSYGEFLGDKMLEVSYGEFLGDKMLEQITCKLTSVFPLYTKHV
jgi:hypothetical protein